MLVDDHEFLRMGVRAAFELEPDIHIVGEASNGAEAVAKISVLDPHVVLMDVRMEKMSGIEACREIKNTHPDIAVLMITSYPDDEAVIASLIAGASGYLLKNVSRAELLKAVREVATGKILLKPEAQNQAIQRITSLANGTQHEPGNELTEREREVLALVARGYTNKRIAEALSVSEKTARNHVSHILVKLGLERRSEAAAYAVEHRLVPPREQS
jgi:DNA-binding NarL/FixJ family response regulator